LLTRHELAQAFDVHIMTPVKWQEAGMPVAERGSKGRPSRYSLPAVVSWFIQRELRARGIDNGAALDPLRERALLDRSRREAIDFELARRRGEYLLVRDVELMHARQIIAAKGQLRAIPSRAAQRLNMGRAGAAVIAELVDCALEELADMTEEDTSRCVDRGRPGDSGPSTGS
jgi:phage terminase Nu1 subunit (DNA packaging protein)